MPMFHVSDEDVAEFKKLRAAFLAAVKLESEYACCDEYNHTHWNKLYDAVQSSFREYEDFCLTFTQSLLADDE